MSLLCMYPVSAVLTAVSIIPYLPPIVWKKNSVAVNPEKKLFLTKPLAYGVYNNLGKCGRDLSVKPYFILLPPTVCCPTHPII